jgi:hypothetical protein
MLSRAQERNNSLRIDDLGTARRVQEATTRSVIGEMYVSNNENEVETRDGDHVDSDSERSNPNEGENSWSDGGVSHTAHEYRDSGGRQARGWWFGRTTGSLSNEWWHTRKRVRPEPLESEVPPLRKAQRRTNSGIALILAFSGPHRRAGDIEGANRPWDHQNCERSFCETGGRPPRSNLEGQGLGIPLAACLGLLDGRGGPIHDPSRDGPFRGASIPVMQLIWQFSFDESASGVDHAGHVHVTAPGEAVHQLAPAYKAWNKALLCMAIYPFLVVPLTAGFAVHFAVFNVFGMVVQTFLLIDIILTFWIWAIIWSTDLYALPNATSPLGCYLMWRPPFRGRLCCLHSLATHG